MRKSLACWFVAAALVGLAAVVTVTRGRPLDLFRLLAFQRGYHDGHFTGYWIHQLSSTNGLVRCRAIRALGAIGPDAAEAVPQLSQVLRHDPNWGPRSEAALALTRMGAAADQAVPALAEAMGDDAATVRMNAALALSGLGERASPAVPALIQALRERRNWTNLGLFHHTIREMAGIALGRSGRGHPDATAALVAALDEAQTPQTRRAMAQGLGDLGPAARSATPLLRALLQESAPEVREAAEMALGKIEGEEGSVHLDTVRDSLAP